MKLLGGLTGVVNLILTPNFETSATKIEKLDNEVKNNEKNRQGDKDKIAQLSNCEKTDSQL